MRAAGALLLVALAVCASCISAAHVELRPYSSLPSTTGASDFRGSDMRPEQLGYLTPPPLALPAGHPYAGPAPQSAPALAAARAAAGPRASGIEALPTQWDWRDKAHLSWISNQFVPTWCGSCWAHGVTAALTDRLRIRAGSSPATSTVNFVKLAPQILLNCGDAGSCNGGSWELANAFMAQTGITDETCMPYLGVDKSFTAEMLGCRSLMCRDCDTVGNCFPINGTKYYADAYGYVNGTEAMMTEIVTNGPIACSMYSNFDSFMNYTGGIINDKTPLQPGNTTHVLSLIGYGHDDASGLDYWVGRNSFGTVWGEGGWFRIVRGINSLNIETHCGWATPRPPPSRQ